MSDVLIPQFAPHWGEEEVGAVNRILTESDYLNEHEAVRLFEQEFARSVGARYCAAVTSGTVALYVAACAMLERDSPVTVPSHDGIFAFNALIAAGVTPSVADVDDSGLLDTPPGHDNSIVVHANGRIARHVGAIEDCAQAVFHHTRGAVSTYSFASTKHITTAGQGGAVCCDSAETFERIIRLKDHGRADRQLLRPMSDNYDVWGMNFKMAEVQAAFGLVQLRQLPHRMDRLREICGIYRDILGGSAEFDDDDPGWYADMFTPKARIVIDRLKKKNIHCRPYPRPLHTQRVAAPYVVGQRRQFPNAERRHSQGVYLPSMTRLTDEEAKRVAEEVLCALA